MKILLLLLAIFQYSVNSATNFYSYEVEKSEDFYINKEQKTLQKIEYLEGKIESLRTFLLSIKSHIAPDAFDG